MQNYIQLHNQSGIVPYNCRYIQRCIRCRKMWYMCFDNCLGILYIVLYNHLCMLLYRDRNMNRNKTEEFLVVSC